MTPKMMRISATFMAVAGLTLGAVSLASPAMAGPGSSKCAKPTSNTQTRTECVFQADTSTSMPNARRAALEQMEEAQKRRGQCVVKRIVEQNIPDEIRNFVVTVYADCPADMGRWG
jgi:hypothetical protein